MATAVTVLDSFLSSAYELPKECSRKVFKALRNLANDPRGVGLHLERLSGGGAGLWSIRVDDDYRIILRKPEQGIPTVLFVGKHDTAYRFAERGSAAGLMSRELANLYQERPRVVNENPLEFMLNNLAGEGVAAAIDLDDLESMVKTRKYLPLSRILLQEPGSEVVYDFTDIELAINDKLPPAARKYRAWWANERGVSRHSQASSWLGVGWRVAKVNFADEEVSFVRQ